MANKTGITFSILEFSLLSALASIWAEACLIFYETPDRLARSDEFQGHFFKSHFRWSRMAVEQDRRSGETISASIREGQHVTACKRGQRHGFRKNVGG